MTLTEQLRSLRDHMTQDLIEREAAVRLALLSALAGEHLLFIGPPGTAKSLIARRLHTVFYDVRYFERLLTRFSVPEELFGPLSIKALERDEYQRKIDGYLPTASIAFIDEIFKANSAILNALLTLLNERRFSNGVKQLDTPLVSVIGASNELPDGEELDALYDRFLLRLHIGPVSDDGFQALLRLRGEARPTIPIDLQLNSGTLRQLQERASAVELSDDVFALLTELRVWLQQQEIAVSDRRWRKIVALLQMSALTNGRDAVSIWDCWLLQHMTWNNPEQRAAIYDWYTHRVGARQAMRPENLTRVIAAWEAQLKNDQESRTQKRDADGQLLYKTPNGKTTTHTEGPHYQFRGKEPLYLSPPNTVKHDGSGYRNRWTAVEDRTNNGRGYTKTEVGELYVKTRSGELYEFNRLKKQSEYFANENNRLTKTSPHPPLMLPTEYSQAYIDQTLGEMDAIGADIQQYCEALERHISALEEDIRDHLWVDDAFVEPARARLEETRGQVLALQARHTALRSGFSQLPVRSKLGKTLKKARR